MIADLAILSDDPFTCPPDELKNLRAVMTVCGEDSTQALREVTPQILETALLPQKQG